MTTENRELDKREPTTPAAAERTRSTQAYVPNADIYERDDALVVVADMPGVDENSVDIHVERSVLTIEGRVEPEVREGHDLSYSEYTPADYRRAFTLSSEIDAGRIEAGIKDGVLRLRLPKSEAALPKKVPVKAV